MYTGGKDSKYFGSYDGMSDDQSYNSQSYSEE